MRLKIQVEVNGVPVKGMKMRLGRAGEAYFVAETSEPPPPEFRASEDPEHGLSDDESYNVEPRATHDDWAIQDESQQRVVDMMVDPPVEGAWGEVPPIASDDRAHVRQYSMGYGSKDDQGKREMRAQLRSSSSAQSVLAGGTAQTLFDASKDDSRVYSDNNSVNRSGTASPDLERRSDDGRIFSSSFSDLATSTSPDHLHTDDLTSSDPIFLTTSSTKPENVNSGKKAHTPAKPSSKSWGLSLFGFLGKKEEPQQQEIIDDDENLLTSKSNAMAVPSGRRTSLDLSEHPRIMQGDEIHTADPSGSGDSAGGMKHIQSSSLPNHWGPSPLLAHGLGGGANVPLNDKANKTDTASERSADEKSRPADDGSGVIYLGTKRKPRSSSITTGSSNAPAKLRPNDPAGATNHKKSNSSLPATTSTSPPPVSNTSNQQNPSSSSVSLPSDPSAAKNSNQKVPTAPIDSRSPVRRQSATSPDSDEEYQDLVFEMDEEAYAAANPKPSSFGAEAYPATGSTTANTSTHGSLTSTSPIFPHASTSGSNNSGLTSPSSPPPNVGFSRPQTSSIPSQTQQYNNMGPTSSGGASENGAKNALISPTNASSLQQSMEAKGSHSTTLLEASRCGMAAVSCAETDPNSAQEAFNAARLTRSAMNEDPSIVFAQDVVFRINGAYYTIHTAAPMLFSVALFNEPLTAPAIERLMHQQHQRSQRLQAAQQQQIQQQQQQQQQSSSTGSIGKAWGRFWQWGNNNNSNPRNANNSSNHKSPATSELEKRSPPTPRHVHARSDDFSSTSSATSSSSTFNASQSYANASSASATTLSPKPQRARAGSKGAPIVMGQGSNNYDASVAQNNSGANQDIRVGGLVNAKENVDSSELATGPQSLFGGAQDASGGIPGAAAAGSNGQPSSGSAGGATHSGDKNSGNSQPSSGPNVAQAGAKGAGIYYVRTLKPSSDKLKALGLKQGANTIVFRVNSRLQGTQQVSSTIFLWDRDSKVVISDIDGTITKSDVLGQIFPVFGKDWSHSGVAALFQNIKANGYEILYLTARAIGAASLTKGFLTSLQQETVRLPDGPVFMSPDRLLYSLNREVILRRPEEFKIQCLNEIKSLFLDPKMTDPKAIAKCPGPFYAGFGNRETDALSYVAVGIPAGKTFTINPSGEITGHSKSIQRTYTKINELVEQMFPPYHMPAGGASSSAAKPAEQWNDFQFWETRPQYSLEELEKELLK